MGNRSNLVALLRPLLQGSNEIRIGGRRKKQKVEQSRSVTPSGGVHLSIKGEKNIGTILRKRFPTNNLFRIYSDDEIDEVVRSQMTQRTFPSAKAPVSQKMDFMNDLNRAIERWHRDNGTMKDYYDRYDRLSIERDIEKGKIVPGKSPKSYPPLFKKSGSLGLGDDEEINKARQWAAQPNPDDPYWELASETAMELVRMIQNPEMAGKRSGKGSPEHHLRQLNEIWYKEEQPLV